MQRADSREVISWSGQPIEFQNEKEGNRLLFDPMVGHVLVPQLLGKNEKMTTEAPTGMSREQLYDLLFNRAAKREIPMKRKLVVDQTTEKSALLQSARLLELLQCGMAYYELFATEGRTTGNTSRTRILARKQTNCFIAFHRLSLDYPFPPAVSSPRIINGCSKVFKMLALPFGVFPEGDPRSVVPGHLYTGRVVD